MASRPHAYSVPALEKAIDIVELLARAPAPLTLSAIAGALGRSPSMIFRVLRTLEGRGYVARGADDGYALTNRLFEQGLQRRTTASLLEVAFPEMRALAARIGQSCHISVPSGARMVTVARVEDPGAASFVIPIGFTMPVAESASGRVYLALLPAAEQAARLAALPSAGRARLEQGLRRIRRRGFELAPSAGIAGITDLSFPLLDADGRPAACLAVPLARRLREPASMPALVEEVRRAAARIDAGLARLRPAAQAAARARPVRARRRA